MEVDGFDVRVVRKNVKHMRMRVAPDGHVELNLPLRGSLAEAEAFVRSKSAWIVRERDRLKESPMAQAEGASEEDKREWKRYVAACVPVLIKRWAPVLGVTPGKLAYRNMRSRWGSCQPQTGRICINTRLALYPPECLEYVVVHELCHLREEGHTPRFWALVGSCLPNYRQVQKKLKS